MYEPMAVAIVGGAAYAMGIVLDARWAALPFLATIVNTAVFPASEEAAFTQALSGNMAGILIAFVTIRALGLEHGALDGDILNFGPLRAIGVLVALILTSVVCSLLRIVQPAAAVTASFLVICGITPTQHTALAMTIELLLVTSLGDIMRRWRVRGAPIK